MIKEQQPGNTTAENDIYVGLGRQLTIDTDRWEIRLHDGVTPGGHRILNLSQLLQLFMSKDSEFGNVAFGENDRGVMTRIGDRQYALRLLKGINGVKITDGGDPAVVNENGQDADFFIGLDPDALAGFFQADRLPYAGPTAGTAAALTVTLPAGWHNVNGSVAAFKFHVAPADDATLRVNALDPKPLVTATGSRKLARYLKVDTIGLFMTVDTNYVLIGMLTPKEIGIEAIAGIVATNVQDALAEIAGGMGGGGINIYRYPLDVTATTSIVVPLADGETKIVYCTYTTQSPQQDSSIILNNQVMIVNGAAPPRIPSTSQGVGSDGRDQFQASPSKLNNLRFDAIVTRSGNKLYFQEIFWQRSQVNNGSNSTAKESRGRPTTEDGYYAMTRIEPGGAITGANFTISGTTHVCYTKLGIKYPG